MTFRTALTLVPVVLLVACKPDPAVGHRKQGDDLLQRSDFAGAAAEYAKSLALDPKQEKIWEKLAFCRVKTGENELAAEALVKVADFRPGVPQKAEVFRNAAGIFLQGPDRAKAERYLAEAVRLDPSDEASLSWLGELAAATGGARFEPAAAVPEALDAAIRYYNRLIELRPGGAAAHANRRVVLEKYLGHLAEEKRREQTSLSGRGRDAGTAAEARERIARIDAKSAELRRMLHESNARLTREKPPAR
jgi:tetratricopeptide (TPR) repeat protein